MVALMYGCLVPLTIVIQIHIHVLQIMRYQRRGMLQKPTRVVLAACAACAASCCKKLLPIDPIPIRPTWAAPISPIPIRPTWAAILYIITKKLTKQKNGKST